MTPPVVKTYVFDASALFHFVAADRLDSLGSLMPSDARSVTTRAVQEELLAKEAEVPLVRLITSAGWLEQVPVDGLEDLWALSTWVQRIGADYCRGMSSRQNRAGRRIRSDRHREINRRPVSLRRKRLRLLGGQERSRAGSAATRSKFTARHRS